MKRIVQTATVLCVTASFCFNTVFAADVKTNANSWAVKNVQKTVELGIMPQSLAYDALADITKEELCILAINFYNMYTDKSAKPTINNPFSDTDFEMNILAYELGIMSDVSNGKFEPTKKVTREQLTVVIYKTMSACGINISGSYDRKFADETDISDSAKIGVNFVVSNGIMSGSGNYFNPKVNVTKEQAATAFLNAYNTVTSQPKNINGKSIYIGDSEDKVISVFGKPQRIDNTMYGYNRYIYNSDYKNLVMIGIKNGKVVDVYTSSENGHYENIKIGEKFSSGGNKYDYDEEINKAVMYDNFVKMEIYCDVNTGEVYSIKISDKKENYSRDVSNYTESLESHIGKEIFDIINGERAKRDIELLLWDDKVSLSAENHSEDMVKNKYLEYNNKDGKTPFERMNDTGVTFNFAAETISKVSGDVFDVMGDIMPNVGKRGNILGTSMDKAGVGVGSESLNIYVTIDMYKS